MALGSPPLRALRAAARDDSRMAAASGSTPMNKVCCSWRARRVIA
jgi:hypothetical protein